jgi:potassium-transporting ATPase KdpC subunit
MKKLLITSCLYTAVTAVLLGIVYPLAVTAIAHIIFPAQASGQLLTAGDDIIGSKLIGQPFTGPNYFHSRPSAAGAGYDASASSPSNLGPSSKSLADRIQASTVSEQISSTPVPIDLVTASGSGLDPDISPASALYQVPRIAKERHLSEDAVQQLITAHITPRQLGILGEPRVNVLQLNLALNELTHNSK